MISEYKHLSLDESSLTVKCYNCEAKYTLCFGDPFEVVHMLNRWYNDLLNELWYHDYGGYWYCPDCKELI